MSDEVQGKPEKVSRTEGKALSADITPTLKGWDYEPGTINVRRIDGTDGAVKLQMRIDLGLLQMELTGRPDGTRPFGFNSLLEYFESMLEEHSVRNGTELGFHLTSAQCQSLRDEAQQYYHRYLGLFVLEDFDGVVRDTARNLRVLDLCEKYAVEEQDRTALEQQRPYITMMNVQAAASMQVEQKQYLEALSTLNEGVDSLRKFFERFDQEEAFEHSHEVRVLKRFAREVRRKLPVDPIQKLQSQLDRAVKQERYEDAAKLRDEIRRKSGQVA